MDFTRWRMINNIGSHCNMSVVADYVVYISVASAQSITHPIWENSRVKVMLPAAP
jgi:hypothetical protein